jgi:hypothetical protein
MNAFKKMIFLIFFVGILAGCATPYRAMIPLQANPPPPIENPILVVTEEPDKVIFQFEASNTTQAMGGGLLFALIDMGLNSASQGKTAELSAPIKEALNDFDLEAKIIKHAKETFGASPWPKIAGIQKQNPALLIKDIKEGIQPLVTLSVRPSMNTQFSSLSIKSVLEIYSGREPSLKGKQREPIYRYTFDEGVEFIENPGKPVENAGQWAEERGKKIIAGLESGLNILFSKIQMALNDPTSAP